MIASRARSSSEVETASGAGMFSSIFVNESRKAARPEGRPWPSERSMSLAVASAWASHAACASVRISWARSSAICLRRPVSTGPGSLCLGATGARPGSIPSLSVMIFTYPVQYAVFPLFPAFFLGFRGDTSSVAKDGDHPTTKKNETSFKWNHRASEVTQTRMKLTSRTAHSTVLQLRITRTMSRTQILKLITTTLATRNHVLQRLTARRNSQPTDATHPTMNTQHLIQQRTPLPTRQLQVTHYRRVLSLNQS